MVLGLNRKSLAEKIDEQLDLERRLILKGQLEKLDPMIAARERMVAELAETVIEDEDHIREIQLLQIKARRNAGLIKAAIEGIKAANERVAEIEAAHSRLSTYSALGQVSDVACAKASISKKA